jgi:hypothetical protein
LREAIQIPPGFSYGDIPPLIMAPGTGSTGCLTFGANFIKQFTDSKFADPVWLNIPDFLYNDAQQNAEYVAYAINYISGISNNKNVSVIAWSQGNLDTQWALKFWPSTRKIVSDLVAISPDFHGTTVSASSSGLGSLGGSSSSGSPPSILQQNYTSQFVAALRANGGDSAYVVSTRLQCVAPYHSLLTMCALSPQRHYSPQRMRLFNLRAERMPLHISKMSVASVLQTTNFKLSVPGTYQASTPPMKACFTTHLRMLSPLML